MKLVDDFWKKWIVQSFQYLVPYPKWCQEFRNLCVGDIVYMFDRDSLKGHYQLGIVDSARPDHDGLVRRVIVKYKISKGSSDSQVQFRYSERPIQNLVLIIPVEEMYSQQSSQDSSKNSTPTTMQPVHDNLVNSSKRSSLITSNSGRIIKAPVKLNL